MQNFYMMMPTPMPIPVPVLQHSTDLFGAVHEPRMPDFSPVL